jgi:hypothetical protein
MAANPNRYLLPNDCSHIKEALDPFKHVPRDEVWFVMLWSPIDPNNTPRRLCKQQYLMEQLNEEKRPITIVEVDETNQYKLSMIVGPMLENDTMHFDEIDARSDNIETILKECATECRMLYWAV